MRRVWIIAAVLIVCLGALELTSQAEKTSVQGDYVEARTASVFAGACHYNGEVVTTGHDAIAAWSFSSGAWDGVDLSGVRALAAITSDGNLGQANASRKTVLVVDSAASDAQAGA